MSAARLRAPDRAPHERDVCSRWSQTAPVASRLQRSATAPAAGTAGGPGVHRHR